LLANSIAVHYQEDIKNNVNKCGLFVKFSFVEKNVSTTSVISPNFAC